MEIKRLKVNDFENAIWGMREPMSSFDRIDSEYCFARGLKCKDCFYKDDSEDGCNVPDSSFAYIVGNNDLDLMKRLYKAGEPHSKFMRQITVSFELVDAPVYWLAEFDTYKVGTVRNSSSFMHKGTSKKFSLQDFEINTDDMSPTEYKAWMNIIETLNVLRDEYIATKDNNVFLAIRKIIPMSCRYNSLITTNYATLANMIQWRRYHRLPEWREFCEFMLSNCPYLKEIMGVE